VDGGLRVENLAALLKLIWDQGRGFIIFVFLENRLTLLGGWEGEVGGEQEREWRKLTLC